VGKLVILGFVGNPRRIASLGSIHVVDLLPEEVYEGLETTFKVYHE
jgi:hypothetical protein